MTVGLRTAMFAVVATIVFVSAPLEATEPQVKLLRNPFERPAIVEQAAITAVANDAESATDDSELRAVLVAGSKSVVDFGGVILQIGESTNGYFLLDVGEGKAIFRRNGEKVVFSLYEPEDDEQR